MTRLLVNRDDVQSLAIRALVLAKYAPQRNAAFKHEWSPEPHQVPPIEWTSEQVQDWLFQGGRGAGKTRTGAEAVLDHIERHGGPHCNVGVGARTYADVRDTCMDGESGLITISPGMWTAYNPSTGYARHRNGARVKMLGAEEPARWNGPQFCFLWRDEYALWNVKSVEASEFTIRLPWKDADGVTHRPQSIITTTPKQRKWLRLLANSPDVIATVATTDDNPYTSHQWRATIHRAYDGTRIGRQELGGEYVEEFEGAMWAYDTIDNARVTEAPELVRVVVAVDPAASANENSDETGIAVVAIGVDGEYYVLAGDGYRLSPHGWGMKVVDAYDRWSADRIIAEVNNGGDMVEATIKTVGSSFDPPRILPISKVTATRGKTVRAEPIAALYEQGRVHHVGRFATLEEQMCAFGAEESGEHDDRVDAVVWGLTELTKRTRMRAL